jgi:UDP-glucuronate 4-epimerase
MKSVLVTGGAGFIGSHVVDRFLERGWRVTAVDNFDPFYPEAIKLRNIARHFDYQHYRLVRADLRHAAELNSSLRGSYDVVVHLAARAGVRPSIRDPIGFQQVNVGGTQNLLEFARQRGIRQFVFASSSSVYGVNTRVPWSEDDCGLLPISPYAGTKISGEMLGHIYSYLHGIRFVALRFFTVYGPRQRPDLAIHQFTRKLFDGQPIPVFGDGGSRRDYTFIEDIVDGIFAAAAYRASPYEVVNLGNNRDIGLLELIAVLESAAGIQAKLKLSPEQPGDVPHTRADISKARRLFGYEPHTSIQEGISQFLAWFERENSMTHAHSA